MAVIAQSVAQHLGSLLVEEAKLLHGVKGKVEELQKELVWMQGFLQDFDKRRQNDQAELIRIWVSEVRDLAYEAEDIVEKYLHGVLVSRNRGDKIWDTLKRFSRVLFHLWAVHEVGSDIDKLIARVSRLNERLKTYGVDIRRPVDEGSSYGARVVELRHTYCHTVEKDLVMRKENVKELVDKLKLVGLESNVVGIVGMGGLGKTTLAREVYRDKAAKAWFDCRAWIYVSQQPQRRRILEEILDALNPNREENINRTNDNELSLMVRKVLEEKRCLIVLDDIWYKETCFILRNALSPILFKSTKSNDNFRKRILVEDDFEAEEKNTESKLVLTTRNEEVVRYMNPAAFIHHPKLLNEDESWMLLCKKAFPRMDESSKIDDEMEKLGRKMLKHCGGLPVAIVSLGGILSTRNNLEEWKEVAENIGIYLTKIAADQDTLMGVTQVLELSYNDLPFYLKPCFLSLGYFPGNSEIPTCTLYQLWLAEGLVQVPAEDELKAKDVSTYDIAEQYLNELVGRCMVQVKDIYYNGRIKLCMMHDAMRDLCLNKSKEEKFLQVVETKDDDDDGNPSNSNSTGTSSSSRHVWKSRRVVYNLEESKEAVDSLFTWEQEHSMQLRSLVLLLPSHHNTMDFVNWFSKMQKAFKLLRVLCLEGDQIIKVPNELGSCIHLRYLKLKLSCSEVPSFVWKLVFLQTFHLQSSSNNLAIRIPNKLWMLKRLVHLYLPKGYEASEKLRLSEPRQMVTLVNINIKHFDEDDLQKMTNLRFVSFIKYYPMDKECLNLALKSPIITSKLQENPVNDLYIRGEGLNDDPKILTSNPVACIKVLHIMGVINHSPECIAFPNSLVALELYGCQVQGDCISQLSIPWLKNLILGWKAIKGNKIVFSLQSFPILNYLELYWPEHLNVLDVEGSLPDDCCLTLRCPQFLKDVIPNDLRRLQHKGTMNVIPRNWDLELPPTTFKV